MVAQGLQVMVCTVMVTNLLAVPAGCLSKNHWSGHEFETSFWCKAHCEIQLPETCRAGSQQQLTSSVPWNSVPSIMALMASASQSSALMNEAQNPSIHNKTPASLNSCVASEGQCSASSHFNWPLPVIKSVGAGHTWQSQQQEVAAEQCLYILTGHRLFVS